MLHRILFVVLVGMAGLIGVSPAFAQPSADPSDQSPRVVQADPVELSRRYPDGGGYRWPRGGDAHQSTGSPRRIVFKGKLILAQAVDARGKPGTSYCSGFTFAVFMDALEASGLADALTADRLKQAQRVWYGATDDRDDAEEQCVRAMVMLGVGGPVAFEDAQPGDFVQFWRSPGRYAFKSGHSAVFLGFATDDAGRRIGIRYRSSQGSTQGIADNTEYFSGSAEHKGSVEPSRVYFGRLHH